MLVCALNVILTCMAVTGNLCPGEYFQWSSVVQCVCVCVLFVCFVGPDLNICLRSSKVYKEAVNKLCANGCLCVTVSVCTFSLSDFFIFSDTFCFVVFHLLVDDLAHLN